MSTFKFLYDFINNDAKVFICKANGDILYTGVLGEMPVNKIRKTSFVKVSGVGKDNHLIIVVKDRGTK